MAENVEIIHSDGTEQVAEVEMERKEIVAKLIEIGYTHEELAEMEDEELAEVYTDEFEEEDDSDGDGDGDSGEEEEEEIES